MTIGPLSVTNYYLYVSTCEWERWEFLMYLDSTPRPTSQSFPYVRYVHHFTILFYPLWTKEGRTFSLWDLSSITNSDYLFHFNKSFPVLFPVTSGFLTVRNSIISYFLHSILLNVLYTCRHHIPRIPLPPSSMSTFSIVLVPFY